MSHAAVERSIEREYRNVGVDNLRWERFVPRAGDIFVCTPPKCGTTWMQAIVAALLFPEGALGPVGPLVIVFVATMWTRNPNRQGLQDRFARSLVVTGEPQ